MRHHLRENFIDSVEDLDTILLARQLDAQLVTGDEGMLQWANKLGIAILEPALLSSVQSRAESPVSQMAIPQMTRHNPPPQQAPLHRTFHQQGRGSGTITTNLPPTARAFIQQNTNNGRVMND